MEVLIPLENENVTLRFFGTLENDLIGFDGDVRFLGRFDSALFREQVVAIMFICGLVFGVVKCR